ncbi:MAG: acyl-CoA dehydrogenase family protein [Gammaproteobacteria bacterium]|nr:acyl-CoA dehydrogenase family protein [Gammaproteobacteria bacterium]
MTLANTVPELGPTDDDSHESARARFLTCAATGLLRHGVDAQYGGFDDTFQALIVAHAELGMRTRDPGLLLAINAHLWGVVFPLLRFGTARQKQDWLPGLLGGEQIGGHAITEPQAGSDIHAMVTTAVAANGGYRVEGHKRYITNAPLADVLVVYAREEGTPSLSAFMVRRDDPGVEFRTGHGIKGYATATIGEVLLPGCELPAERLLGKQGAGAVMIQLALEHERAFIFAGMTGVMRWQLQRAIEYARTRPAGSGYLAGVQGVTHRIADMQLRLETTRLWIRECAQLLDEGKRITLASAQAKLYASEAFLQSSLDAAHILGASGLEGELPELVHDAMAGRLLSGSSEIQKNIIAAMLGLGVKKS